MSTPAPAFAWDDAERATVAALADDHRIVNPWQYSQRFGQYMADNFPAADAYPFIKWADMADLYAVRRFGTPARMATVVFHADEQSHARMIARFTNDEITAAMPHVTTNNTISVRIRRRLHRALYDRASDEEKEHMHERADIGQSNVVSYIADALGDNVALTARVSAFLQPDLEPERPLDGVQTRTRVIDRLRRLPGFTNPRATAQQRADAIERFAHGVYQNIQYMYNPSAGDGGDQWQRLMRYLTPVELARLLAFAVRIEPLHHSPQHAHDMTVLLSAAVRTLRLERAALNASGLIQWLAQRDADAAMHLSTHVTRTVVPSDPHTHITTQPAVWMQRLLQRMAKSKRAREAAVAVASRTRARTTAAAAAAQPESKHDDE